MAAAALDGAVVAVLVGLALYGAYRLLWAQNRGQGCGTCSATAKPRVWAAHGRDDPKRPAR